MSKSVDRYLQRQTRLTRKAAALGRVFNVTRETWALTSDPSLVAPMMELVISRRTASEAADLARAAARALPRHGFHKPSAAWWGADETHFHRFVVHVGRRRTGGAVLLLSSVAGLLAFGFLRQRRPKPGN